MYGSWGRLTSHSRRTSRARIVVAEPTRIDTLSAGDPELKFAYRRKIGKELGYDERSKPTIRRALKMKKRKAQDGKCAICTELLSREIRGARQAEGGGRIHVREHALDLRTV